MALAVPARAADTSDSDFHCLVIGTVMSNAENEQLRNAGLYMTIYYLGRLDGSGRQVDFKGGYKTEIARLPQEDMEAEAKSCGALLTARGAALSAMGKEIAPDAAPEKPVP